MHNGSAGPMPENPKVFCSHRRIDKPAVKELARKLLAAGIEAWVDEWEIQPGDNFVAAINRGLESRDVGLIFFSSEVAGGKWVQAEIDALTVMTVEDNKPLIPVMLDAAVPLPPLLRSRSRLGFDQIDQLIDEHEKVGRKSPELQICDQHERMAGSGIGAIEIKRLQRCARLRIRSAGPKICSELIAKLVSCLS